MITIYCAMMLVLPTPEPEIRTIEGLYWCEGKTPDHKKYHGTVIITKIDQAYIFQYQFVGKLTSYHGIGQRHGHKVAVACHHLQAIYSYHYTIRQTNRTLTLEGSCVGMIGREVNSTPSRETLILIKSLPTD